MRLLLTPQPLDVATVVSLVSRPDCGAIATFVGITRDHNAGRRVLYLEYEAYAPLALKALDRIQQEISGRWPDVGVAIHHRSGRVEIGQPSVIIAAASPHRAEAFAAARYAIERVKQIAPIWKREFFEGGAQWVEGAVAHPDDEEAREAAFARTCG
jgi:molybdopterin synthase catalytic subunit